MCGIVCVTHIHTLTHICGTLSCVYLPIPFDALWLVVGVLNINSSMFLFLVWDTCGGGVVAIANAGVMAIRHIIILIHNEFMVPYCVCFGLDCYSSMLEIDHHRFDRDHRDKLALSPRLLSSFFHLYTYVHYNLSFWSNPLVYFSRITFFTVVWFQILLSFMNWQIGQSLINYCHETILF